MQRSHLTLKSGLSLDRDSNYALTQVLSYIPGIRAVGFFWGCFEVCSASSF